MNKIPLWILVGSVVLAFTAGMLNATALMGFTHVSVSHVTGNVSMVARTFLLEDWSGFRLFVVSIASFWAGSVLSGAIIGTSKLTQGKNYGLAMYAEFVLLALALCLFLQGSDWGQMLLAMACGLQNSMVTTYDGIVVRTTHLTGTTSDLGATVGNWLVGRKVSTKRIIIQSAIWWGFFAGGFAAVFLYAMVGYYVMVVPITIVLLSAATYNIVGRLFVRAERILNVKAERYRRQRRAKRKSNTFPKN